MKTLKILLLLITLNSCTVEQQKQNWELYAIELQNEGYSKKASEHIAKVDYLMIPIDEYYEALIED